MSEPVVVTVSTFEEARDAYRQKELRQALYDEGEIIMGDVLVNLHGDEHRARRRLENRLFRRDTFAV
ncbi:MAG TPA: cytochrome P450, partial [Acidimicrobiia bacterium]|nr:cytochrome P450 [Acidimicrobiia bacterium]